MSCDCGCCAGAHVTTPLAERNRPGLREIGHRPGSYTTFVETMRARLSSTDFPELAALRVRDASDPALALCDAWAITAEVLAFYQDRIANEGYLRTATERNSLLQLGRLTGYEMRPGVAASVYLAYTIDPNGAAVTIPIGTRAQSVPAAGQTMQTFETAEPLSARPEWSRIGVRRQQPQWRRPQTLDDEGTLRNDKGAGDVDGYNVLERGLYLQGTNTQLKANDVIVIDFGNNVMTPYRVESAQADATAQHTRVALRSWNAPQRKSVAAFAGHAGIAVPKTLVDDGHDDAIAPTARIGAVVRQLAIPLTPQPRNALALQRDVQTTLRAGAELYSRTLLAHRPNLRDTLVPALGSVDVTAGKIVAIKVYVMRSRAAVFGNGLQDFVPVHAKTATGVAFQPVSLRLAWADLDAEALRSGQWIPLDATYDKITVNDPSRDAASLVVIDRPRIGDEKTGHTAVYAIDDTDVASMTVGIGLSARVTQLHVGTAWLRPKQVEALNIDGGRAALRSAASSNEVPRPDDIAVLRRTHVYAQSERLELAPDPLDEPVSSATLDPEIELDHYYAGIAPGMWVIAAGERAGLVLADGTPDTATTVEVAERAMIVAVRHGLKQLDDDAKSNLPGDTLHTYIRLATPLTYAYTRATFSLFGNVVRATHGETRKETLGAGDATQVLQSFALKSPPLTFVAAPTPAGVASTLQVRVNNLLWHEVGDLASAPAEARVFATRRDDAGTTRLVFGDGRHGARLPTGQDNVGAVYRSGIGAAGNVAAGQLTVAADKPLGVVAVGNPLRASGGADADTLQLARVNAPLSVTALDRLVSVQDYADFACTFAGIGKAVAAKLPGPGGDFVHLTVAGIDDIPIDTTSDLYRDLVAALHAFGDPHLAIRVEVREALALVMQATVALQPDYQWDSVQPAIQAALACRFGFGLRALGQPLFGSEVIATIHAVAGVAHVVAGSVTLLDDDDLIDGLAPASAATALVPDAPRAWFSLHPLDAHDVAQSGVAAHGWLPVSFAAVADRATGATTPAQIAYLPAGIADCLILELAP